jgi:hypothetical protein
MQIRGRGKVFLRIERGHFIQDEGTMIDSLGSEKLPKGKIALIDPARNDTRGNLEFLGLSELRMADLACLEPIFPTSLERHQCRKTGHLNPYS